MNKTTNIPRKAFLSLVLCGFAISTTSASLLELTPSSFGRIQDNITLGSNAGTTDSLNTGTGFLYVGDHDNNNSVYHVGYKFDLDQDWSFLTEETTFSLSVEVNNIQNAGWDPIALYHVPTHVPTTVTIGVILGGTLISTYDTSGIVAGDFMVFDVTSYVLDDIANDRAYSTFRFSQETLFNNGNGVRDALTLNANPTLTAIPEPGHFALFFGGLLAAYMIWRKRRS